jgi:hypothetical protein
MYYTAPRVIPESMGFPKTNITPFLPMYYEFVSTVAARGAVCLME